MSDKPIKDPSIPYVGPLQSSIAPGKFVRILGNSSPIGKEFSCYLQCGSSKFDDVVLQLSVGLEAGTIVLNSQQHGIWSEPQPLTNSHIDRGQQFEILVICEPTVFKIGINAQHLCEFPYKIPYYRITYLRIEGDVSISHISVENQPTAPSPDGHSGTMSSPPPYQAAVFQSPYPATGSQSVVPPQPPYPAAGPPQNVMPQPPYPISGPPLTTTAKPPYPPISGPPQPPYPFTGPQQTVPVPLNSAPQTIVYAPAPGYASDPLLQQQAVSAALNATPRAYAPPFWQRSYYSYRGNKKMVFIILGAFGIFSIVILTVFLIVFFKAQDSHDEFRKKHFGDN